MREEGKKTNKQIFLALSSVKETINVEGLKKINRRPGRNRDKTLERLCRRDKESKEEEGERE